MDPRRVGGVAAAVILLFAVSAPALADGSGTAATGTSMEAWYTTTEACEPPADCSMLPPPSAYPQDTLHVGATGGRPNAVTYLELDTSGVPGDAKLTGGTLTLPINTDSRSGTLGADTAQLVACLVTEKIDDEAEGSLEAPPASECESASSPATFAAEPEPAFTVGLAAFAEQWAQAEEPRLAILPASEAQVGDTWHVSFWGKDNDSESAAPITAKLTYTAGNTRDELPPLPDSSLAGPGEGELVDGGLTDPPVAEPIAGEAPEGAASLDGDAEPAPVAGEPEAAPQAAPATFEAPYPYPVAWLMPLLLLIGFAMTGRALTKNLGLAR